MVQKGLEKLFHETLKDVYYAERKILKALPKMSRAAQSDELKTVLSAHADETQVHIERLQEVFEMLGKRAQGKTCEAIEGLLSEGEEIINEFSDQPALDAGIIASAQAVEHYEIARYGTLKRWAAMLGKKDAARILDQTLKEEFQADTKLTQVAESTANEMALTA